MTRQKRISLNRSPPQIRPPADAIGRGVEYACCALYRSNDLRYIKPSARTCSRVSSSASSQRSKSMSTSDSSMMSGGQNATRIPPPVQARSSTPRRVQASVTPGGEGQVEALLRLLVLDDLDRADETHSGRIADDRMIAECGEPLLRVPADLAHVGADVHLVVDLQRLQRDRGRDRMTGVGEAGAEDAGLAGRAPGWAP